MVIKRSIFFVVLFAVIFIIFPGPRLVWLLRSKQTTGVFYYQTSGNALEQFRESYSELYFQLGRDTVWFKGPAGLGLKKGDAVAVRYLPSDPADAKVKVFRAMWGGIVVYGGIFFVVLLAVSLHPDIVPRKSKLRLTIRRPFVEIM